MKLCSVPDPAQPGHGRCPCTDRTPETVVPWDKHEMGENEEGAQSRQQRLKLLHKSKIGVSFAEVATF